MRQVTTSLLLAVGFALGAGAGGALADTYSTGSVIGQKGSDEFYVRYDTDGDGSLADEVAVIRTRAQLEQEDNIVVLLEDHALEAVDVNGDGYIGANEWVAESGSYFGSLDLNNNGIVDEEE
jgi:hypothetical protein